jgi:potassium-transporting ATPase KdpC subunit
MKSQIIIALKFLVVMTFLTGIIYPLVMTGIAQLSYPSKANGSLIMKDGKIVGSELIGQKFDSSAYFWSRPSAINYNPVPSGATNFGPTSDTLKKLVDTRRTLFAEKNHVPDKSAIPAEMVFASGSGLDPDISPEAALMQADRVVKARNLNGIQKEKLLTAIENLTQGPQFFFLGEKRINVFMLNLELDALASPEPLGIDSHVH